MEKTMTPSESITQSQIGKIQELLAAGLRKAQLQQEPVQQVIETQGKALTAALVAAVRTFVEAVSNLIARVVRVNRQRTPQEAIAATKRATYTDASVVSAMPKGEGEETTVSFFHVGRRLTDDELEKEFELRKFKPADPYSLAAANEEDPAFADERPNGTHWKDKEGKWCYAAFDRWHDGKRRVGVDRNDDDWGDGWWFAGLRK